MKNFDYSHLNWNEDQMFWIFLGTLLQERNTFEVHLIWEIYWKCHCFVLWHFLQWGYLSVLSRRLRKEGVDESGNWQCRRERRCQDTPGRWGGHSAGRRMGSNSGNESGTRRSNSTSRHHPNSVVSNVVQSCLCLFNLWPEHNRKMEMLSFGPDNNAWKLSTPNLECSGQDTGCFSSFLAMVVCCLSHRPLAAAWGTWLEFLPARAQTWWSVNPLVRLSAPLPPCLPPLRLEPVCPWGPPASPLVLSHLSFRLNSQSWLLKLPTLDYENEDCEVLQILQHSTFLGGGNVSVCNVRHTCLAPNSVYMCLAWRKH